MIGGGNRSSLIMNFLNYLQQGGSNHGLTVSNLVHDMEDEDNEYLDEDEIDGGHIQYHGMMGDSDEIEGYGDEEDGEEEYEEVYDDDGEEEEEEEGDDEGEEEMPELDDLEQHSNEEHQQEGEQHRQGTGCSKGIIEIERDSESD
jgi:hypothetical protein